MNNMKNLLILLTFITLCSCDKAYTKKELDIKKATKRAYILSDSVELNVVSTTKQVKYPIYLVKDKHGNLDYYYPEYISNGVVYYYKLEE